MSALRVAIAGYGLGGAVFHGPMVECTDGLQVAHVVTRSPERAAAARAAHDGVEIHSSLDGIWDETDLLVVTTPTQLHAEQARAAIAHGVPVVVDKPLAVSAAEGRAVVAEAAAAGVALTVFQNRRWDGDWITVRRLAESGALGEITRLESRFDRWRPEVDGENWREHEEAGPAGGLLFDLGSHLVDQARELLGQPLTVYAEIDRRRPGAHADDDVFLALEHPGGARSHLHMSAVAPLHGPRLRVSGTAGGFSCAGLDPQEQQLIDGHRPGESGFGRRGAGRIVDAEGSREQPLAAGRYHDFYAGVRDALTGSGALPVDPADSVAVLAILDAARESATSGTVISIEKEQ